MDAEAVGDSRGIGPDRDPSARAQESGDRLLQRRQRLGRGTRCRPARALGRREQCGVGRVGVTGTLAGFGPATQTRDRAERGRQHRERCDHRAERVLVTRELGRELQLVVRSRADVARFGAREAHVERARRQLPSEARERVTEAVGDPGIRANRDDRRRAQTRSRRGCAIGRRYDQPRPERTTARPRLAALDGLREVRGHFAHRGHAVGEPGSPEPLAGERRRVGVHVDESRDHGRIARVDHPWRRRQQAAAHDRRDAPVRHVDVDVAPIFGAHAIEQSPDLYDVVLGGTRGRPLEVDLG